MKPYWEYNKEHLIEKENEITQYEELCTNILREIKTINTNLEATKEELQTTRIELAETKTNLQTTRTELTETKTELKADLSETKTNLQTTQTELTEERTLHETTRTQLRNTQTELDVAKIKLLNIEARMQIIESNISKVVV
tara:strand:- start:422 stop:844 length:423 start_codon:yes stop_codon:yes gene_type:complete